MQDVIARRCGAFHSYRGTCCLGWLRNSAQARAVHLLCDRARRLRTRGSCSRCASKWGLQRRTGSFGRHMSVTRSTNPRAPTPSRLPTFVAKARSNTENCCFDFLLQLSKETLSPSEAFLNEFADPADQGPDYRRLPASDLCSNAEEAGRHRSTSARIPDDQASLLHPSLLDVQIINSAYFKPFAPCLQA